MGMATWEEREQAIHALFMERLREEMGGVTQGELARRMGGGVTQGNLSRWISGKDAKMPVGRFGTAISALGGDPKKAFAAVVADAVSRGLMEPGTATAMIKRGSAPRDDLADRRRAQEAEADRIKADEDAGKSALDIADAADHGGDE